MQRNILHPTVILIFFATKAYSQGGEKNDLKLYEYTLTELYKVIQNLKYISKLYEIPLDALHWQ